MWKHFFTKTVLGAVGAATVHIISDPKNPIAWGESVGLVVAAWGARDAIAKNGEGK